MREKIDKYWEGLEKFNPLLIIAICCAPEIAKLLPKNRILSENEWRVIGVQKSRGWVHYAIHRPEPHIRFFRRTLNDQQQLQNLLGTKVPHRMLERILNKYKIDEPLLLLPIGFRRTLNDQQQMQNQAMAISRNYYAP
ncbi:hypothetical protein Bca4012_036398 [Brassica carinata]|uniref:Cyclin-dependent kinases regulatory subunit n=1 Tax=Brassica carinata TaxID=52824 RepID=A0A8X8BAK1_BRACI|nr:hypothetical protein Bca52824_010126 [Brassica carinata]